jgi:hypothetical protein
MAFQDKAGIAAANASRLSLTSPTSAEERERTVASLILTSN